MKRCPFAAISVLILLIVMMRMAPVRACGPYYWFYEVTEAPDYYFTRFVASPTSNDRFVEWNCRQWAQQVGGMVSEEDVRKAVYDYSLDVWEKMMGYVCEGAPMLLPPVYAENAFLQRLMATRDSVSVRLLCHSKRYEAIRGRQLDPWTYRPTKNPERDLRRCADYARGCFDRTHSTRALLLAVKSLFALEADQECINLWRRVASHVAPSPLRDMAEGYVAGCMARKGDKMGASEIYMRIGDLESLLQLNGERTLIDLTEEVYARNPNAAMLTDAVQYMLLAWHWPYVNLDSRYLVYQFINGDDNTRQRLLSLALRAADHPSVRNRNMWRYAAAALYDSQGQSERALAMLDRVEPTVDEDYLSDAIAMLRCKELMKTMPMGKDYEQMLRQQYLWLEGRWHELMAQMKQDQRTILRREEPNELYMNFTSAFTWGDESLAHQGMQMLYLQLQWRQMVKNHVLPRLLADGQVIHALQVANASENGFFACIGSTALDGKRFGQMDGDDPNDWYYYYQGNGFDFSNEAFLLADSMDAQTLVDYWNCLEKNKGDDRFWNSRSYANKDYWYEQIGTHWMRQQEFATAVEWLQRVDPEYQSRTNLRGWYQYDPFLVGNQRWLHPEQAKLTFARRMAQLKNTMEFSPNADERGLAGVQYATALAHATDECWPLMSYGKGWQTGDWDEKTSSYIVTGYETESVWGRCYNHARPLQLRNEATVLLQRSLSMIRDREALAQAHAFLGHISYVVKHLTQTSTAQFYARHCDEWSDYIM